MLLVLLLSVKILTSGQDCELNAMNLLHFCFNPEFLFIYFFLHLNLQEIQFLEFMGGSNLTHAHSSYLLCMHFAVCTSNISLKKNIGLYVMQSNSLIGNISGNTRSHQFCWNEKERSMVSHAKKCIFFSSICIGGSLRKFAILTHSEKFTGDWDNCHYCIILKEWLIMVFFAYMFCVLLFIAKSRPWLERTTPEDHFDVYVI